MIPILYDRGETAFLSNGIGRLRDTISAEVVEERNGVYELTFSYPADGAHFSEIVPGRIVLVTHDDTGDTQPFDIVSFERPIDGVVTFHAVHISYRQSEIVTIAKNVSGITAAFNHLNVMDNPFTYWTDITNQSAYVAAYDGVPKTARQILGGVEGSILDAFGGEYEWDRFQVKLHKSRGEVRPITIRYGVNMLDYNEQLDTAGAFNSCVPYWAGVDDDGGQVVVIGGRIDSGMDLETGRDVCVPLDLTEKFETKPTKVQLNAMAASVMNARQTYIAGRSITVDFIRLQDMPEYADILALSTCQLCDTVTVAFPWYNQFAQFKIVRTVWDVLSERYTEMELGKLSTTLSEALGITGAASFRETSGNGGGVSDVMVNGASVVDPDGIAMVTDASGNLTINGNLKVNGHATQVGYQTQVYTGTQNIATGISWLPTGRSLSLGAGTWIVEGQITYESNSSGRRGIALYYGGSADNRNTDTRMAVNGAVTRMKIAGVVTLTATTTVYLYGVQNSGGQLSQTSHMVATRIA